MEEIYKKYMSMYEVSNFGNVRRKLLSGNYKELKCSSMNRGYKYFQQRRDGKRINHLIHHIVAQLFLGERPENKVIDHIDRDKLNNKVSNLRYCTQLENMKNQDKYKHDITEKDPKKRHSLVCKLYAHENREAVLKNKREYYQNHKEHIQEYQKTLFELRCDECHKVRHITRTGFNRSKRMGINICRACQATRNLGDYLKKPRLQKV
jgi:hypothetical protein